MENSPALLGMLYQTLLYYENLQIDPLRANTVQFSVKINM